MTYREYLTWQCWLDDQMNEPSRTDFYVMQVASEIRSFFNVRFAKSGVKPIIPGPSDMKLKINRAKPQKARKTLSPQEKQSLADRSKAMWCAAVGYFRKGKKDGNRVGSRPVDRKVNRGQQRVPADVPGGQRRNRRTERRGGSGH